MFEKTKQYIEVMQAAIAGKKIQTRCINIFYIQDWLDVNDEPIWNFKMYEYRIKPEPKYEPYKSFEEAKSALNRIVLYNGYRYEIVAISKTHLFITRDASKYHVDYKFDFAESFDYLTFPDGTKVGTLVVDLPDYVNNDDEDIPF